MDSFIVFYPYLVNDHMKWLLPDKNLLPTYSHVWMWNLDIDW